MEDNNNNNNNSNNNNEESIDSKYTILEQKGKGLTSEVFKVKEVSNQKIYAAKVYIKNSSLFQSEVDMLNILKEKNNPYMINIINSGIGKIIRKDQPEENKQYIILDYAEKGELLQYIKVLETPLIERHAKFIFYKILKGVEVCHKAGICHRDIKGDNILLDESFVPKICDFGFATRNNGLLIDICGTERYLAPEIFLKRAYDGFKIDIFSLGVLLLNLNTCKFGFGYAIAKDKYYIYIMKKCYKQYWAILSNEISDLSEDLKSLYLQMVSFKPSERPTIEQIYNSNWMKEIKEMKEEQLDELENEIREEFLKREIKLNEVKKNNKKEINNNSSSSSSSRGLRSLSEENGLFDPNLKPNYVKSKLNMDNYIELTGDINPVKFMNDLVRKIKELDELNISINVSENKLKFNVTFENEEEYLEITDEMKEELKNLGINEKELNYYDEENENIKGKRTVVQIKMYESFNGGYLLRFIKKEGVLIDYLDNVKKIYSLIKEM